MKRNLLKTLFAGAFLSMIFPLTASADVEINETNFPDENFRKYLLGQSYGRDSVLTDEEIEGITRMTFSSMQRQISSLKGIEFFTALTNLSITNLPLLTELDVSKNIALTRLSCFNTQLAFLDVSGCTALTEIDCHGNQLLALDVSACTLLTNLHCQQNKIKGTAMDTLINGLPQVDNNGEFYVYDASSGVDEGNVCTKSQIATAKAKGWTPYYYSGYYWYEYEGVVAIVDEATFPDENFRNYLLSQSYGKDSILTDEEVKSITSMSVNSKDISSLKGIEYFSALKELNCSYNQLTSLDVSQNPALTQLRCYNNQLVSLDVSQNPTLEQLYCYNNQLTSLDISQNPALKQLECYDNQLVSLDVSQNPALIQLWCYNNQLASLDVSQHPTLEWLFCHNNKLTFLDISQNPALEQLYCYDNQLASLDVSQNPALEQLYCYDNQLASLDVSQNPALMRLHCSYNQLTILDVSQNPAMYQLWCNGNQLTSLDVSKNPVLVTLSCYENDIKGASMDTLVNGLPQLDNYGELYVYNGSDNVDEGNICTKHQVAVIKTKGWTPFCFVGYDYTEDGWPIPNWQEYEGSDDESTGIAVSEAEIRKGNGIAYTLSGQKVANVKKGIYIVNGKKVVIK